MTRRKKPQPTKRAKPKGWRAFDALARKLVRVPKTEVDRLEAERPKRGE